MDDDRKKQLKARFKQNEREVLSASLPIAVDELKYLLSCLNDESLVCDHTLKNTTAFLMARNINPAAVVPWLNKHGGYCDCEVIGNVYDAVGHILGWHLDNEI